MAEEVTITFETLYDLLRREKNMDELQELNTDFFRQVISYLGEKQAILENSSEQESLFGYEDKKQTRIQLDNIKRILRELYDIREKKIITLARDVSRTGVSLVNEKAFLEEEKQLYQKMLGILNKFRSGVLANVLTSKMPLIEDEEPKTIKRETEQQNKSSWLVRFVEPVSEFVGPELVNFGPYKKDDVATLPMKVAQVLINKKSAELINEEE